MSLYLLLRLLAAHFIADFILQPKSWVEKRGVQKVKSKNLYLHTLVIFILTFAAAGNLSLLWVVLVITLSHYLIDLGKSYLEKDTPVIFITDQLLHIFIIFACWLIYTSNYPQVKNHLIHLFNSPEFWLFVTAYLIVTTPTSVLISKFTSKWMSDIDDSNRSLKDAGKWIGIIERILILTFIILNQFEAIGFLIAAKSVFRFGELKDGKDQKRVEYILIGTLISFLAAIIIGIISNAARIALF
jgi:Protein of unknown function (DUF3307)